MLSVAFYLVIFVYGIVVGSFLNVCILRTPLKESIVTKRSHCMTCGHQLAWYDLFPLFSYLFLGGKCRYCKAKISAQYPIIEALNGVIAVLCFAFGGFFPHLIENVSDWVPMKSGIEVLDWAMPWYQNGCLLLNCFVCSALIVIALVDWRTFEIPVGANIFIGVMGIIKLVFAMLVDTRYYNIQADIDGVTPTFWQSLNANGAWLEYVIGFFAVSTFLYLIVLLSKGRAMGGGDVKLMAVAGLFLGWKLSLVALLLGCFYGSVIHLVRMAISKEGHRLAMGPYLAAGIVSAMWFGQYIIEWYAGFF